MRRRLLPLLVLLAAMAFGQGQRPWFLGPDGGVYRGLERVGLGVGTSLAVAGERAYLVGMDQRVWTSGPRGDWHVADPSALAIKVAAASDGAVFLLGTDLGVYRLGVGRVGLGVGTDLAVGEGHDLYVVGTDGRVWTSPEARGSWTPFNDGILARHVAAAPDGSVAILGLDGYPYALTSRRAERLGSLAGKSLTLASDGAPYLVTLDEAVYFLRGGDWQRLGTGRARQIVWPR